MKGCSVTITFTTINWEVLALLMYGMTLVDYSIAYDDHIIRGEN